MEIQTKLQGVIGQKAWNVRHTIGSFVTMEFGQPLPPEDSSETIHGEWNLWVQGGEWRLENKEQVLVASGDEGAKMDTEIRCLEGLVLQSFEVMTPALDALLTFEHDLSSVFLVAFRKKQKTEEWIPGSFSLQMKAM